MNLETFLAAVAPLNLLTAEAGIFRIRHQDRAAMEFGLQKEIFTGTWAEGNDLNFTALTPRGRDLLTRLFGDVLLRRAVEREFTTRTRFHLKSALKFATQAAEGLPPQSPQPSEPPHSTQPPESEASAS
ncbi:hypothetical protein SAMN05444156_2682 [Verrucomicrobium sp. GAS474]|uniref:hypothetical protein n=1 Tax=Verrucomicrobium sp. GAS474 TaxID=1882831 RepID=UPI00087AC030|nr:hypothetical protein [Verrucomicrobium sp. GAS474]SDU22020.1 hypothetical protein SAMN05444156_2682 [Verrucomicrobium sp. GAS474]